MKFLGSSQIWAVHGMNIKGRIIHPLEIRVNAVVSLEFSCRKLRLRWQLYGAICCLQQLSATNVSGDSVVQQPLPLHDGLGGSFHFNRSNRRKTELRKID